MHCLQVTFYVTKNYANFLKKEENVSNIKNVLYIKYSFKIEYLHWNYLFKLDRLF